MAPKQRRLADGDPATRFTERYDAGVILRAHRFRAERAGYRLERGHYMDGESDRSDRWYIVPTGTDPDHAAEWRRGSGYRSAADAAKAAEERARTTGVTDPTPKLVTETPPTVATAVTESRPARPREAVTDGERGNA